MVGASTSHIHPVIICLLKDNKIIKWLDSGAAQPDIPSLVPNLGAERCR